MNDIKIYDYRFCVHPHLGAKAFVYTTVVEVVSTGRRDVVNRQNSEDTKVRRPLKNK